MPLQYQGVAIGTLTGLFQATLVVRTGQPGMCSGAQRFDAVCLHGCCAANSLSVLLTLYQD